MVAHYDQASFEKQSEPVESTTSAVNPLSLFFTPMTFGVLYVQNVTAMWQETVKGTELDPQELADCIAFGQLVLTKSIERMMAPK